MMLLQQQQQASMQQTLLQFPTADRKVVVRREIRSMPREDQERFVAAVMHLMDSAQQGGSEWLRLAGYHGWPSNDGRGYCVHRAEAFPGWHRAYLLDMEAALQAADEALGGDGSIALPYWDFSRYEINGEVVPRVIREAFGKDFRFPAKFFPKEAAQSGARGVQRFLEAQFQDLNSDERVLRKLRRAAVREKSNECLDTFTNVEHWQHASTENKRSESVESPHNATHNALGYPLTSLKFAAFHPMFWLLHCNSDRQYEKYIEIETREECLAELRSHQAMAAATGSRNLLLSELAPFQRPKALGEGGFMLEDTLLPLAELGYAYDELPPRPKQMLREKPAFALFRNVDVATQLLDADGEMKSFDVHVFLCKTDASDRTERRAAVQAAVDQSAAGSGPEIEVWAESHEGYAGVCSLFGGKGPSCANCRENGVINARVELNETLARLGASSRLETDILAVVCEDETGALVMLDDVQTVYGPGVVIPTPEIVGPALETSLADVSRELAGADTVSSTIAVQRALAQRGFYDGAVDGDLGARTDAAIVALQRFAGLKQDGLVGHVTRAALRVARIDAHPDEAPQHHRDDVVEPEAALRTGRISYFVGACPGYLDEALVRREISAALAEWESTGAVEFTAAKDAAAADVVIQWADHTADNKMVFDGPGGEVARADASSITFDVAERWTCDADGDDGSSAQAPKARLRRRGRVFSVRAVCLHEIGHVLGLHHRPTGIMAPYYSASRTRLSEEDKNLLRGGLA